MRQFWLFLCFMIFISVPAAATDITWNPSDKGSSISLSNGNLTATVGAGTGTNCAVRATVGKSTGKWYWEVVAGSLGYVRNGVSTVSFSVACGALQLGGDSYGWAIGSLGWAWYNNAYTTGWPAPVSGDVLMIAVDLDADKIWIGENGTWAGSPTAGTGQMFSSVSGTIYPTATLSNSGPTLTLRCKISNCAYSPPSGYSYYQAPPAISGTLKLKESDASGAALEFLAVKRSDGSVLSKGTASASGAYSITVTDTTTEYDVYMFDPDDVYNPKVVAERVVGVEP